MNRNITKNIKQLKELGQDYDGKYYTLYAFFDRLIRESPTVWRLGDYSNLDGLDILISNIDKSYPRPKKGDIIRIHRLGYNQKLSLPECIVPRNILIWSSFKEEPTKYSSARKITYCSDDDLKRESLENDFYHKIHKIQDIYSEPISYSPTFIDLAVKVIDKQVDEKFGNVLLRLVDGTVSSTAIDNYHTLVSNRTYPLKVLQNSVVLLVYSMQSEKETDIHRQKALATEIGDYVYITQVKATIYRTNKARLYLSANEDHERSFRSIESQSVIGKKINFECEKNFPELNTCTINQKVPDEEHALDNEQIPLLADCHIYSSQSSSSHLESRQPNDLEQTTRNFLEDQTIPLSQVPPPRGTYRFRNIVGQVMATKNINPYNNHLLLIEDGSSIEYASCFLQEFILEPNLDLRNKATVLIYDKKFPNESDAHISVARQLKPGDWISIVNAKVSWKDNKLKIELSANLDHNKSLKKIEKNQVQNIEQNNSSQPQVEHNSDQIITEQNIEQQQPVVAELPTITTITRHQELENFDECFEEPSQLGPVEE